MKPEQFCYWLQGFSELNSAPPTAAQWKEIQDHLKSVFKQFERKSDDFVFPTFDCTRADSGLIC